MTLAHSWVLHFLWILPIAGFVLIVQNRRRLRRLERFGDKEILARLTLADHRGKRIAKGILLLCALGLLLLALAGPRWGSRYQEVSRKGVDIMIAVDVSQSMVVEDVKPSRLERASREIVDFLKVVEGDRVGLAAFAGAAFVLCPLTLDYAALELFVNTLGTDLIPAPGTDIGTAIEAGISAFDFNTETDKVMLLITDGEDNEQQGLAAARKAARKGVRIYVFGIGEPSGGPVPAGGNQGGFKKDSDGNLVLSKLDENSLRQIAAATGGGYVRSVSGDLDLDLLYFEGIKQETQAQTLKSGKIKVYDERFYVFVLAAFLCLLFEGVLEGKQRPVTKTRFGFLIAVTICFIVLFQTNTAMAAESSPDELYRQGKYEEAEKEYSRLDMDHPKDIRYRYNRGCAAFQIGKQKEASAAFSSVLKRSQDPRVRFKAAFNLGNTAFKLGDFEAAAAYYKQALIHNPKSEDARHNLELSLLAEKESKEKESGPQDHDKTADTREKEHPKQHRQNHDSQDRSDNSEPEKKNGEEDYRKDQKPESQPPPEEKQDRENAQKGGDQGSPQDSPSEMETAMNENREQESTSDEKPESGSDKNLQGDLKPRQAMPEQKQEKNASGNDESTMEKKRAEALIDNIQENPSKILRFIIPGEDQRGNWSGKDW